MDINFTPEDAFFPQEVMDDWTSFLRAFNNCMVPIFNKAGIEKNVGLLAIMLNHNIEAIYGLDEGGEWEG